MHVLNVISLSLTSSLIGFSRKTSAHFRHYSIEKKTSNISSFNATRDALELQVFGFGISVEQSVEKQITV